VFVRTTVSLEPDVEQLIRQLMREKGMGFKQALNHAIRLGLSTRSGVSDHATPAYDMGFDPAVPHDHALRLVGELEDQELVRKMQARR
jgi:hypothetical protein